MAPQTLPPQISREAASEAAKRIDVLAKQLRQLADSPTAEGEWGLACADAGVDLVAIGTVLADSGAAVAAMEGHSLRAIGEHLGVAFSALPRRLAGTPELADYAEESKSGSPRVSQGGIERARYDVRQGQYTVEGEIERVPRRRKRGA